MNFSILPSRLQTARCPSLFIFGLVVALLLTSTRPADANVYATNLRIDGGHTNLIYASSTNVGISYLLNEPASGGVTIVIQSNAAAIRTIALPGGGAGTARGSNYVIWDGRDDATNDLSPGLYSIHVTAASIGHGSWTQISNDADEGNYAYAPTSIAVNRNQTSPFYGRVFLGNALANPGGVFLPGDAVGLIKANADGSLAQEGGFSDGGWAWAGDFYSPWKIEVSADDHVYVNDWTTNGLLLRFDQAISPASRQLILRPDNWPHDGEADLSGPAITGTGGDMQIWMADINRAPDGVGIRRFNVTASGEVATNDTGATIVTTGGSSQLTDFPYDVALDASNRIYTIQFEISSGSPSYRVLRFPAFSNNSPALTNADWRIGAGDDNLRGAYGIAVNPAATRVAVALSGVGFGISRVGGGVRVLDAETGANITTISPAPFHDHTDVAWDAVGNLYVCDNWDAVWRAYSPPGTNYATTVALATVRIGDPPVPPTLTEPTYAGSQFQFTLNGQANVTYFILASTNLQSWVSVATNTTASEKRLISVPAPAGFGFYRAVLSQ